MHLSPCRGRPCGPEAGLRHAILYIDGVGHTRLQVAELNNEWVRCPNMRIIYLHQYFNTPEDRGGTRSYEMARRFVEWGHEVHMVTSDRRESSRFRGWRQRTVEGIQVYERAIPYSNRSSYRQRMRAFVTFAVASARLAAAIPADVVIATSTPLTIAFPALYARWRQRIPMVFEVRDLWPEMPVSLGALRNPILIAAARWLERVAYRGSTEIVALSPGTAAGISAVATPVRQVTIIPNAADLDVFQARLRSARAFDSAMAGWPGGRWSCTREPLDE